MPLFLAAGTIREAIARLGNSRALPALSDYLVFKRAIVLQRGDDSLADPTQVITGSKSKSFMQAVTEVAAWAPGVTRAQEGSPYFKTFGASRDNKGNGYVSHRYWSNGPSDTINSWQARSTPPIERVPDRSPMTFKFPEPNAEALTRDLLLKADLPLPRLVDAAIWWFRFSDLEDRLGTGEPDEAALAHAFVDDLGLTAVELNTLFDRT